jgi:hypothetical protein
LATHTTNLSHPSPFVDQKFFILIFVSGANKGTLCTTTRPLILFFLLLFRISDPTSDSTTTTTTTTATTIIIIIITILSLPARRPQ